MNVLVLDKIENLINLRFFCPLCFLGEDGFDLLKFQPHVLFFVLQRVGSNEL